MKKKGEEREEVVKEFCERVNNMVMMLIEDKYSKRREEEVERLKREIN